MEEFHGIDYLNIESELTDDELQVRDTVREFVNSEAIKEIPDHFRQGIFPHHLIPRMGELGIFGAHIDGYGCAGIGSVAYGLIMQELERADSGYRSFASVQSSLAMTAIYLFGTEDQRKFYLPDMAKGTTLGCFALTEADHGSDPSGMNTLATRSGKGFVLNGSKMWITNAGISKVAVVWAYFEGSIRAFLVDMSLEGVSVQDIKNKLSMRMSVTSGIQFDNVLLPEDSLLLGTKGLGSALECLNSARYSIIWGVCGAAADSLHTAIEYTKSRIQFNKPLAGFQMVQEKLSDMATALSKAQLLALHLGRLKDKNQLHWSHVSMGKYSNTRAALEIARNCRDLLGAAGITDDFSPLRHAINLETVHTYEGTEHMHQLILGRHITGLNAIN
ncbi:MAG: acyl-CoA dehydrogenase [Chloroflexi bacterium]|nr:acyl-CoA dehydrogenase [Chloroflexota bacterium]MBI68101.1 acyl-CoA dehydrogenase [Chloroflexota bacterium]MCH2532057.1 acyl-CoA dehydrogenase family protein [Dehalococcoidia bacterium]HCH36112.1 acyl-CoA dehydrogenase [Dehalococcoidia bacterium]|tara:strand:- start:4813 stop:5979 length:1167 start_codon:yes stop_codon:yes gene_type:complete